MSTTALERLRSELPNSETQWRSIAASAHRTRGYPGDESAAKTHELAIWEIRSALSPGSSREPRFCPACLDRRGVKYQLLFIGGIDRYGTCTWPG